MTIVGCHSHKLPIGLKDWGISMTYRDVHMPHMLMRGIAGSRLYGTYRDDSDYDSRGVYLEPVPTLIGLQPPPKPKEGGDDEEDDVMYSFRHFIHLALKANPNILDVLFTPPEYRLFSTREWEKIYELRHDFLSQRVRKTYAGYAVSQLKKVQRHRRWITNPPHPFDDDFRQFTEWARNRNPARAELEAKYGYDTKHSAHLFRLILQGGAILTMGTFTPVLSGPDLEIIKDVLNGEYQYEHLVLFAEEQLAYLDTLPTYLDAEPAFAKIESVVMNMLYDHIQQAHTIR